MVHLRLIIPADRTRCIKQRRQQVLLIIPNSGTSPFHTGYDILDMAIISSMNKGFLMCFMAIPPCLAHEKSQTKGREDPLPDLLWSYEIEKERSYPACLSGAFRNILKGTHKYGHMPFLKSHFSNIIFHLL